MTDGPRIVVAGGHSAGHIEPAMAVADAVRRLAPSAEITALGTERGLDTKLIPLRGYPLELIPPVPLSRKLNKALFQTPGKLRAAVARAGNVLDRTRAEAVVGFGGYVAVPAYLAARKRRIPIVVHEANALPGVANRMAARLTRHVFTASSQVKLRHGVPIGIPIRPAISTLDRDAVRDRARAEFGLDADRPTLLVTGGSQGALAINATMGAAAPALLKAGIQVLHIVGPGKPFDPPTGDAPYVAVPFVEDMTLAYSAADFVICRSGAMTCAELTAVGLPAAYVPLPLRGGEQRLNAEPIVAAGGGLLVDQENFTAGWVAAKIVPLLTDRERLAAMAAAAEHAGARDADVVLDVAAAHRRSKDAT